jgi:gluconolactonase
MIHHTILPLFLFISAAQAQMPSVERMDPALDALLDAQAPIETLAQGYQWSEGPVWDSAAGELLFSDVPNNVIHAWNPEQGLRVFMKPSGYTGIADYGRQPGSNGLAFDSHQQLILCEHGDRRLAKLTTQGGKITLADRFEGRRFNSPNDLAIHPDGSIFFTDPIYGLPKRENDPMRELDFCGVFRVGNDGKVTLITRSIERPNGIALSPDGKTLFVADSHGPRPHLFSIALNSDGTCGEPKTFFDAGSLTGRGVPDGLKIDADGFLWATGPGGLIILSPNGKLLGRVLTHRATSNVAFGGKDGKSVFLTAHDRILHFMRK